MTDLPTPPGLLGFSRTPCFTHLALGGCWLLVEAKAEQSRGGSRHLGLKLTAQLPVVDAATLAS